MLTRALKMAFWVVWDHLGKLMLASLIWSLAVTVPGSLAYGAVDSGDTVVMVTVGLPILLGCLGIVLPVVTVGLAHMAKELIDTRDGSLRAMFTGMRRFGGRAAAMGMLFLMGAGCLGTSVWFYASKLSASVPWLGYAISGLALWALMVLGLMALLAMPAVVQKKAGVAETLKITALLVADNPLMTVGLALQVVACTAVALAIAPVFFVLYGAVVVVLTSTTYEMLARKYAAIEARNIAEQSGLDLAEIEAAGRQVDDENDDYLNRGVRDMLFPWKG